MSLPNFRSNSYLLLVPNEDEIEREKVEKWQTETGQAQCPTGEN